MRYLKTVFAALALIVCANGCTPCKDKCCDVKCCDKKCTCADCKCCGACCK